MTYKCGECGLMFNTVSAFDRHRTGEYGRRDERRRRCRTRDEMTEIGMFERNGRWYGERMPIAAIAAKQEGAKTTYPLLG
jgi:hypothetical protein